MSPAKRSLPVQISLLTLIRTVMQTMTRMVYPFLAVFARGMGVEVGSITTALGISMVTSLLGPLLAQITDKYGRRVGILLGLSIFTLSAALVVIFPVFPIFALSLFLGNLAINLFLPAVFAFLSDHTSYAKRGLVMGIFEISWAMCYIVLVPLFGILISNKGWQNAYSALTVLGVISILLVVLILPKDDARILKPVKDSIKLKNIFSYKPAIMILLFGLFLAGGNELVSVMFGVWMEETFSLQIAALGVASAVIGFSELGGEGLSAWITDHVGKERAVAGGLLVNCLALIVFPLLSQTHTTALVWLFLVYFSFEWAMVSSLALTSEIMPQMRATLLSAYIASHAISRMLADFIAPWIYLNGFLYNALSCLILNLIALYLLRKVKSNAA
jgi:predicted MFS family arabinose efflux permease